MSEYGEEGPPSPVSNEVTLLDPTQQTVSMIIPGLSNNTSNINRIRIYRSATTADSAGFLFVAELPLASTSYVDDVATDALGPELATDDYDPPPDDMQGLVSMPGGFLLGFTGNTICPSAAYLPYAYPVGNQLTTADNIVAIGVTSAGAVVTTQGFPYLLTGYTPDSLTLTKLEEDQACVSKRSLVDMGEFVIYASPDGLVAAGAGGIELITAGVMTQAQWQTYQPQTLHAYHHEGLYVGFYGDAAGNGNGVGGFVFDPKSKDFRRLSFYAMTGYRDLYSDKLYLVTADGLQMWESGSPLQLRWQSKEFIYPVPVGYSCAKVTGADLTGAVLVVIADGIEILTMPLVGTASTFRLPAVKARTWQVRLEGGVHIYSLSLATSMGELQ